MTFKYMLAATSAALLLTAGGVVQAQQMTPGSSGAPAEQTAPATRSPGAATNAQIDVSALHEVKSDQTMVPSLNMNVDKLSGMDIKDAQGEKVASIDKVLADSSNHVKAVTADVGGFLGIGSREVVIPIDQIQKGQEQDTLQTSMNKSEIQNLQAWKSDKGGAPGGDNAPAGGPGTGPGIGGGAAPNR